MDSNRYLGRLCPHGHDNGQGRSLRFIANSDCCACSNERIGRYYRSAAGRATAKKSKLKMRASIRAKSKEYRRKKRPQIDAYNRVYREENRHWYLTYYRDYNNRRRADLLRATPRWADEDAIYRFYSDATEQTTATGIRHEVDHIVPLHSRKVCGLHTEANLRVIPKRENASKGNRWWPACGI